MGQQIRIRFIKKGFQDILSSEGAREVCEQAGGIIQAQANANLNDETSKGYAMSSRFVKAYGSRRNMTFVYSTDHASMVAEAKDKALSRAVTG